MNNMIDECQYWVAKNMICIPNKINKIEDEKIENFISKHKEIIESVIAYMPRGMTTVGAAIAKCAIQYDKDKSINFIKNSKERIFQGKEDPAYHFYLWLHGLKGPKRKKHDISTYEITFYACKQYCFGKKIKRLARSKDNMGWNENWEINFKKQIIDDQPKTISDHANEKEEITPEIIAEFINKLKAQNISTNDFIAALQKKKKSSPKLNKSS